MIFEIFTTTIMGGLAGYSYFKKSGVPKSDADKIQRIFTNAGLTIREEGKVKTIRLQRKRQFEGGIEYIYQLPLGLSSKEIIDKKHVLEDGLNVKSKNHEFEFRNLKELKLDKTIVRQIQRLIRQKRNKRKEIEIEFDGMLKIKVFYESMQERYDWSDTYLKPGTWSISIGNTRNGVVRHDFDKHKHLIIAGATGYGKSVVLKLIVTSLVLQQAEFVNLHLIDLKGGSAFQRFKDLKQTKSFTRDPYEAKAILSNVQEKMNKTYQDIVDLGFEDIKESGRKERHFIIIDEAADIADDKECMDVVTDIARRGRGAGYYLIYATQYPSSQSIPQQTKRNIPSRLCFVLDDATASNTALGQTGAEDLPLIPGRGIYKNVKSHIIQVPFISNMEIQNQISLYIVIKNGKEETNEHRARKENRTDTFTLEEM